MLGLGLVLGGINGSVVVGTRVPDIVVTLAMGFVWAGFALLVRASPGGGAASWLKALAVGSLGNEWIPKAAVVLIVVVVVIWIPLSRSSVYQRPLTLLAKGAVSPAAARDETASMPKIAASAILAAINARI